MHAKPAHNLTRSPSHTFFDSSPAIATVDSVFTGGAPTAATPRGPLRFVSLARLTVHEKLERTLERGEYTAALALAISHGISGDLVRKREWRDRCAGGFLFF